MTQQGRATEGGTARAALVRGGSHRAMFIDRFAEIIITAGGLTVLAAMLGICAFLFASAAPLLTGGAFGDAESADTGAGGPAAVALIVEAGEGHAMVLRRDASVVTVDVAGERAGGAKPTARSLGPSGEDGLAPIVTALSYDPKGFAVMGLADGRLAFRSFSYTRYPVALDTGAFPGGLPPVGASRGIGAEERSVVETELRLPAGTLSAGAYLRVDDTGEATVWDLRLGGFETIDVRADGPLTRVHAHGVGSARWPFVASIGDGREVIVGRVRTTRRLDGAGERRSVRSDTFALELPAGTVTEGAIPKPIGVFAVGDGSSVVAVWAEGVAQHYTEVSGVWQLAASVGLAVDGLARRATAAAAALGGRSILVGDNGGAVHRLMIVPGAEGETERLVVAGLAELGDSGVASIGVQGQGRTVAVALEDGTLAVVAPTSGDIIATRKGTADDAAPIAVGLAGDLDSVATLTADGRLTVHELEAGHPDAGPRALFGRVWYEEYAAPQHVYQSTGAPGAEPKFGLMPLVFGTLKATIAAMLIAVPLAVAGAVYTSEFLHPNVRRVIKPTIELMASLPSVVLGFVAAVMIAPLARDFLPALLVAFAVVPFVLSLGSRLYRLLPEPVRRGRSTLGQLVIVSVVLAGGVGASVLVAPTLETAVFTPTEDERLVMAGVWEPVPVGAVPDGLRDVLPRDAAHATLDAQGLFVREGSYVRVPELPAEERAMLLEPTADLSGIRRWLDGEFGGPWPGWLMLMIPVAVIAVGVADGRVDRLWIAFGGEYGTRAAVTDTVRFVLRTVAALGLASALASVLSGMGLDARDSIFGPFSQRNTIVVGIAMGFAVIPIIYTISEDAMSSVPPSLRAASLGSGATPWQTAARVVLPVAASGIFSACMVGLGRAVGETMIVLMATGNTPEISANIFSGFRTLAANIAVELPEAPRGGTHYRVLFLCGLILFVMTLIINTTAELVRQRVRRKNAGL